VKFSRQGKVRRQKQYGGYGNQRPFGITQTQDGGFIMVGRAGRGSSVMYFNAHIVKVDSMGNKQWSWTFGNDIPSFASDAIPYGNNKILVFGTQSIKNNFKSDRPYMLSLNLQGVKQRKVLFDMHPKFQITKSSPILADSTIVLTGEIIKEGDQGSKGMLMKVDPATGEQRWLRTFDHKPYQNEYIFDMAVTPDKGFVVTGSAWGAYSQDLWLAKLDSLGCDTPNCAYPTGLPSSEVPAGLSLNLYPNPAGKAVTVRLQGRKPSGRLQVYTMLGREVLSREVNRAALTLNTRELEAGVYLVQWVRQQEIQATKKLIVK
jgi:hypothetical protein